MDSNFLDYKQVEFIKYCGSFQWKSKTIEKYHVSFFHKLKRKKNVSNVVRNTHKWMSQTKKNHNNKTSWFYVEFVLYTSLACLLLHDQNWKLQQYENLMNISHANMLKKKYLQARTICMVFFHFKMRLVDSNYVAPIHLHTCICEDLNWFEEIKERKKKT